MIIEKFLRRWGTRAHGARNGSMANADDLAHLRAYLERNKLCTLATVGADGTPWASTVFFAFDAAFTFYFFSNPATLHARNIMANPRVAVAVNQEWGGHGTIRGVQLVGGADRPTEGDAERADACFAARYRWVARFATDHVTFRITPTEIWMIDSVRFGHFNRVRMR